MTAYDDLGIRPIINAAATLTRLGGSLMPPPVVEAMVAASGSFIDLDALQERVGERIAAITQNDACYVSSGAAAGLTLSVAAFITGEDRTAIASFPFLEGRKNEVIIHRCQRNGYDYAIRQLGVQLVEIGMVLNTSAWELESAITPQTACVIYFAGAHFSRGALPLEQVIEIAHRQGVPVIVDAAAQIPPIANLWHFTRELGADIAVFSGGKGLRGPQSAGLILGREDVINACKLNGSPNSSVGRPMKICKEELMGMLAAVEWSLAQDETALLERYEEIVQYWLDGLSGLPGVQVLRGYPSEAGQPHGRAIVRLEPECSVTRDELAIALMKGDPSIAVSVVDSDSIALNPQTIEDGEEIVVLDALRHVLTRTPFSVSI